MTVKLPPPLPADATDQQLVHDLQLAAAVLVESTQTDTTVSTLLHRAGERLAWYVWVVEERQRAEVDHAT